MRSSQRRRDPAVARRRQSQKSAGLHTAASLFEEGSRPPGLKKRRTNPIRSLDISRCQIYFASRKTDEGLDETKPSMRGRMSSEAVQILCRGLPHIPFAVGFGRSGPSQTSSAVEVVVHTRHTSSEPEAEGERSPSTAGSVRGDGRRDVIRSTIYSGSPGRPDVAIKPESKGRHHSMARRSAMGPPSGFVAGSSSWSSRPPAFARQVARSHRGWVRFTLAQILPGRGDPLRVRPAPGALTSRLRVGQAARRPREIL